jgi:hypothetical protein
MVQRSVLKAACCVPFSNCHRGPQPQQHGSRYGLGWPKVWCICVLEFVLEGAVFHSPFANCMIWPRIADFLRKQFKQHREVGKTTGAGKPLATGSAPAVKINKLSSQSSSFASSAKTGKTKPAGRSADGNYLRVYVPDPVSSKPSPRNRTAKAKPSNADFNTDTSSLGEIDRSQGHGKPAGGKKKGEKVSRTPIPR